VRDLTANKTSEADRDSPRPRRARNRLCARRLGMAAGPAAQLNR